MKLRPLAILVMLPLWACASQPDAAAPAASGTPPASNAPAASAAAPAGPSGTAKVLGILATPIYLAFKLPFCLGSPLTAPGAAASAVIPFDDKSSGTGGSALTHAVSDACGPPYMATWH